MSDTRVDPTVVDGNQPENAAGDGFTPLTPKVTGTSDKKFYTEEDIQKAREQEKSKLYKRMESMQEQVARLQQESQARAEAEEARQREIAEQQRQEEEALRARQESEMSAKDLLAQREQEWNSRLEQIQQQMEQERALREREHQYAELMAFRQQVVQQYSDRVAPELLDLIQGDTPEEVQQSAEDMAARTERILAQTAEAMQNVRQQSPTARVTMPMTGETPSSQMPRSADDIRDMSMAEYAKQRQALLGKGANGPKSRGLFG